MCQCCIRPDNSAVSDGRCYAGSFALLHRAGARHAGRALAKKSNTPRYTCVHAITGRLLPIARSRPRPLTRNYALGGEVSTSVRELANCPSVKLQASLMQSMRLFSFSPLPKGVARGIGCRSLTEPTSQSAGSSSETAERAVSSRPMQHTHLTGPQIRCPQCGFVAFLPCKTNWPRSVRP